MTTRKSDSIRDKVRERYAGIAVGNRKSRGAVTSCCCSPQPSSDKAQSGCCSTQPPSAKKQSAQLGYSAAELNAVPEGANMGLGCGNPQAIAMLKKGEVVIDLGAGGGFDCFLAAKQVGRQGKVIGVDMTPEMISKARENARQGRFTNVEFRLGEIEHLPVADNTANAIISNCVINLSPDKPQVYRDAYRVLKPGGRLAISDLVAIKPIPQFVKRDFEKHSGCVAGASPLRELERILKSAGFRNICVTVKENSAEFIKDWFPGSGVEKYVRSAEVRATKR